MNITRSGLAVATISLISLAFIGCSFAAVGAPESTPEPTTHTVAPTPTPNMYECPTEDYTPPTGACYWTGGDNGKGRSFTVYSGGTVKYDTPENHAD